MNEQKKLDISVLYVEDDAATRDEVVLFLNRRVREIMTASNGQDGLALFRQHRPDLIITDIRMPVMDGLTMARAIRDAFKGALIIVTTAHSDISYMLAAVDIGVDQYVIKPISMEKLLAAVEKCAETVEHRRSHQRYIAERERLITDLQKALAEIKTLHGILPICSYCKKIRDDKGAWKQLEAYISEHTDALFSHGICSECFEKTYPEIARKKRDSGTQGETGGSGAVK